MSLLFTQENIQDYQFKNNNDLFNSSSNDNTNYLGSEINKNNLKEISNNNNSSQINTNIPNPKSILDSKFYLIKKIGQGSSAKVYLGLSIDSLFDNNNPNQLKYYSIKVMDPHKTDLNIFKTEIKLLEKINHENILKYLHMVLAKKKVVIKIKIKFQKKYII